MPQHYWLLQVFLDSAEAGSGSYGSIVMTKGHMFRYGIIQESSHISNDN